jgi:1,4-alpha-glucan branching enzyme
MIEDRQVDLIRTASHGDPFSVLGVHADERGWLWLRCFLPGASEVALLGARSEQVLALLERRHADGFFECAFPVGAPSNYRLKARWADGSASTTPTASRRFLARWTSG